MLKPEERVVELGRALVKQVFAISRVGAVAGCHVVRGTIERDCRIRVIRDSRMIGDYPLDSLRREKDDVREVRAGPGMRHQAGRLQRRQEGRRAGSLQDRGSRPNVVSGAATVDRAISDRDRLRAPFSPAMHP